MIDHAGFAVSDYERSKAFYAEVLAPLGITLIMEPMGQAAATRGGRGRPPRANRVAASRPGRGRNGVRPGTSSRSAPADRNRG